jgi:hypothetical protein
MKQSHCDLELRAKEEKQVVKKPYQRPEIVIYRDLGEVIGGQASN